MTKICEAEGCDEDVSERSRSPYCKNCNGNVRSWAKRSPGDIEKRRTQLSKYSFRMSMVGEYKPARAKTKTRLRSGHGRAKQAERRA